MFSHGEDLGNFPDYYLRESEIVSGLFDFVLSGRASPSLGFRQALWITITTRSGGLT